ncbi:MAG TPA: hypothetical protein VF941_21740 [Clostridia bacterium]
MLFPILQNSSDHCTLEMLTKEFQEEGIIHIAEDGHLTFWGWEN